MRGLRARDPRAAANSGVLIALVSALVLTALPLFEVPMGGPVARTIHASAVLGLVAAGLAFRFLPPEVLDRWNAVALLALAGVGLIGTLNVLTRDTSAGSQAFYAFPVLWAAFHLRPRAVAVVTGAALASDLLTLVLLLPLPAALTDFTFFGAVLAVNAALLVRSNRAQERLVDALQRQVTVDSLTGLATRRALDEALEAALTRSVPGGTALVLIDVDSFKAINDNHGHPVGDDVLVHLAGVLRENVRAEDAVLSRLGGDELAVLLPGCDRDVASRRAAELLDAVLAQPLTLADGTLLSLSISVGVAHVQRHDSDRRALYISADAALYEAKRAGRGRVALAPA